MARRFAHWRREGGQKKAKAGRGTTLGIGFYVALFWAFPSYSFLVQREESKQQRKVEDGGKKQPPCRNGRRLKSKACAVAEKGASKNESASKINNSRLTSNCRAERHSEKYQSWQRRLPGNEAFSHHGRWQYEIACASIVFAIHPSNGHEVRKLPEKYDCKKQPSIAVEASASGGPADQRRRGTRKGTNQRAQRGFPFQRRV